MRDWYERNVLKGKKGEAGLLLAFEDPTNVQDLFDKLKQYSLQVMGKSAVATAGEVENDPLHYYINPQYDDQQLDLIEDVWRNDAVVRSGVRKYNRAIMTKHGKTVLDTGLEYSKEEERRKALDGINGNTRYTTAKQKVDKVLTSRAVNFHQAYSELREARYIYGRSAALKNKDPITDMLTGLEILDPKRLGRVKVNKITKKIVAVEYMDTLELPSGKFIVALESQTTEQQTQKVGPNFIPIEDLVYLVKTDGGIVKHSRYVGVSGIEPCIHISQVKRIILNEMLKEAAKALYAGQGRVFFPPDTPSGMMTEFIDMIKRNVGRWFGYKIPGLEITVDQIKTEIDKYEPIVDLINREILRCIGLASFMVGYEQIANYANSEQIMLGTKELDVNFERTEVKDDIKYDILDPLFAYFLNEGDVFGSKVMKNNQTLRVNPKAKPEQLQQYTAKEELEYIDRLETDKEVKLTYEFQEINFSTRLESSQAGGQIKTMIPYIPDEALLKLVGMEDWVEETLQAKEAYEEKELEKQKLMFEHEDNLAKMRGSAIGKPAYGGSKSKPATNKAAAAASADDLLAAIDPQDPEIRELVKEMLKARIEAYKQFTK